MTKEMTMNLYIYDIETGLHVATIAGDTNHACETLASDRYGSNDHTWTYTPGELSGVAEEITVGFVERQSGCIIAARDITHWIAGIPSTQFSDSAETVYRASIHSTPGAGRTPAVLSSGVFYYLDLVD